MTPILTEAFLDTLRAAPFLLVTYLLLEHFGHRYGERAREVIAGAGRFGPVLGAALGCVPQCGFAVMAALLYVRGVVSFGTLLAVFLSTSDEAVPVILSYPDRIPLIGPLLLGKLIIASVAGMATDAFLRDRCRGSRAEAEPALPHGGHMGVCHEHGWGHTVRCAVSQSASVLTLLFAVTLALTALTEAGGEEHMRSVLLGNSPVQPLLAGLVGIIPNCAASVAVTKAYLGGAISFGSAVAGLCAGAGAGPLVLVRLNGRRADTWTAIGLLYAWSAAAGLALHWLGLGLPAGWR